MYLCEATVCFIYGINSSQASMPNFIFSEFMYTLRSSREFNSLIREPVYSIKRVLTLLIFILSQSD